MTKAQALAILSDVVVYYVESGDGINQANNDQVEEALATLGKDWEPEK